MAPRVVGRVPWLLAGAALAGGLGFASPRPWVAAQAQREPPGEWRTYAGSSRGLKYSPLDQITQDNVKDLEMTWKWSSVEVALQKSSPILQVSRNENTPLMANGALYTVTGLGLVAALDPGTGETRWVFDTESHKLGRPNNGGFLSRSFGYWTDGTLERLLVGTHDAYLLSIDARTGKLDPTFGARGRVDLAEGIRDVQRSTNLSARGPLIAGNVAVVGSSISDATRDPRRMPPGYVKAFDVRTGKPLWTFHTVPRAGEVGYDTWLDGSAEFNGNTNVWAQMAYDPELDYVYMPVSTPSSDYYGGDRPGNNLFAESLVCVEAKTGKRVWHCQAVHHGLWDYDFPTHPVLGDITVNGRRIRAVIQVSKQAFAYVLDRRTGHPVWPIEERPVPQSTVPGERTSRTQPFPTRPPAFDLQGAVEENLLDFTPELRQRALDQLRQFVSGPLFTPPSEQGTLSLPGNLGGANWGGAAFDPETSTLYVPSRTTPTVLYAVPRVPGSSGPAPPPPAAGAGATPRNLSTLLTVDGLPLFKPPYARVTAINLNTGEHRWTAALGNGPRNHPALKGLNLPPLGDAIDGTGVLLTKNVLFATTWRRQRGNGRPLVPSWAPWGDPDAQRKLVYAFDKQTGALLREFDVDGYSAAPPMTYVYRGRQYLVMAVGGNEDAALVAFALPDSQRN
ncbi:MAG: pyrroloquinoline quinone-dependent dehydrogenase [Acidobacteria bacterium]|nr:MAG: pyrroloquinoline quinone-dependent dehydrogenase [Acidobacteriota bacterium]